MKVAKLHRKWKDRVGALGSDIARLSGTRAAEVPAGTIHGLRVLLRRLRLLAKVGQPVLGKSTAAQIRKWSGHALDRLGPIRDFDSAIEWLEKNGQPADLIGRLGAVRNHRLQRLRRFLAAIPAGRPKMGSLAKATGRQQERLRQRYDRETRRCQQIVNGQSSPLARLKAVEQHDFRRVIRRLRYLRELAVSRKQRARDPFLKRLIRLQDALGTVQNGRILRTVLPRLCGAASARPLVPELEREIAGGLARAEKQLRQLRTKLK